ncbi:hypothetical protein IKA92_06270 [bacterium]|nr:hypothetical protein [bacterium]
MKNCPFKNTECTKECALYIAYEDMNEMVYGRLKALGVVDSGSGMCSLKNMALAQSRYMFENTEVYRK